MMQVMERFYGGLAMAHDTVTLALNGDDVELAQFGKALRAMAALLEGLRDEIPQGKSVTFHVDSLSAGSAVATARCVGPAEAVTDLIKRYEAAGRSYRNSRTSGVSQKVDKALANIVSVLNGNIHSVRLETLDADIEIERNPAGDGEAEEQPGPSVGTVQGRIETIARRQGLRFTIYELHTDKPVSCYLAQGHEEILREAWGRLAIVAGLARRDPRTDRITTLRQVSDVEIIPEVAPEECLGVIGAYRPTTNEPPEATIRRLRDADNN